MLIRPSRPGIISRRHICKWDSTRGGFNLTIDRYDGATLASWGVKLVRESPDVTWRWAGDPTNVYMSDGIAAPAAGTTHGVPSGWSQPAGTRVWNPEFDWATFDAWVDDLEAHDIRVVIDPHWFPGFTNYYTMSCAWPFQYYWQYVLNAASYWGAVAQHFAGRGVVIAGYDLINEPQYCRATSGPLNGLEFPAIVTADSLPSAGVRATMPGYQASDPDWNIGDNDPRSWRAFVDAMITAIRQYDRRHTIIVEAHGNGGSTSPATYAAGSYVARASNSARWYCPTDTLGSGNRVFSYHMYEPAELMTEGTRGGGIGENIGYPTSSLTSHPGQTIDSTWLSNYLATFFAFCVTNGVKPFIGEFGPDCVFQTDAAATSWPLRLNAKELLTDLVHIFKANDCAYTYHTVNESPTSDAAPRDPVFFQRLKDLWSGVV